jgi:putative glutamine amidotransferase
MKRIGLTQRVEVVPSYGERRDCLDQNWARFLLEAGLLPVPLSNAVSDVTAYVDALELDGVVLTGGNDPSSLSGARNTAPERDRFESLLVTHCRERKLPLIGVCRGMQVLNLELGGNAISASGLGDGLEPVATCADGTVEVLRHRDGLFHGLMWHPEREQPFREWDLAFFSRTLGAE